MYEGDAAAPPAVAQTKGERKIKYWISPMDPGYVRDKPGKAPCGMDLVPVYEDEPVATAAAPKGERKIKYWISPMDPGYVRDKPGKAPCGMDLVPVYEDTEVGNNGRRDYCRLPQYPSIHGSAYCQSPGAAPFPHHPGGQPGHV